MEPRQRRQKQPSELVRVTVIPPPPMSREEADIMYRNLAKTVGRILALHEGTRRSSESGVG